MHPYQLCDKSIVSDNELSHVFMNTNFGTKDYRSLVHKALIKKACGYHCGHSITKILLELGLVSRTGPHLPTKKGREMLRVALQDITCG